MSTVLVVDDQLSLLRTVADNLRRRGYEVELASTGAEALAHTQLGHIDAVILDLGLPDISGMEVLASIRGWTSVPVIVLSARSEQMQKVAALDMGANDYITKPFGMDELMARVRVVLRADQPSLSDPVVRTGHFTIDLAARRLTLADGRVVRLTRTEWQMVQLLARNPGCLITHHQMLAQIWGMTGGGSNYIRVFMVSIRRKLEPDPSTPRYFITEPGCGVRFVPDPGPVQYPDLCGARPV
jgi:two-component system, OmpR family, KDP operon response regulator KdpE